MKNALKKKKKRPRLKFKTGLALIRLRPTVEPKRFPVSPDHLIKGRINISFYGKLPTYPSPKPTFCPKSEVSVNVDSGEGRVDSFSEA